MLIRIPEFPRSPEQAGLLWTRLRTSENFAGTSLAILIGVGAGFGAVAFWQVIKFFSWLFFAQGASVFGFLGDYYVIILPTLGGLIFGPIIYFFAREATGEGPPEIMESIATNGGRIRARVAAIKVLVSSICIGSGGSVGREGPIVQIGGSIGSTIGQWFRVPADWLPTLVLCGVAGGVSATFNAPIAGAFFALEVIQRRIVARNVGVVILSSVTANVIARVFLFSEELPTSFVIPEYSLVNNWEIVLYALLGLACAVVAGIFLKVFYLTEDVFAAWKIPTYLKPAIGGLVIGLIGFVYPQVFGVGYGEHYAVGGELVKLGGVDRALLGELDLNLALVLIILKLIATSITLGSGGSGGVFAPALFIGAVLGSAFGSVAGELFPGITAPVGAYAMVGMAAFFAVVVRGPITAIIILFEMTGDYEIILPLMTAVVIGTIVARTFTNGSIYTIRLRRRGVDLRRMEERDIMRTVTVAQAMTRNFPTVPPTMSAKELLAHMEKLGHHGFPVVDEKGRFRGIVTLTDVHLAMEKKGIDLATLSVEDIAVKAPVVAYPDQTLHQALFQLGAKDYGRIPVVDRNDHTQFLGLLRRHDILRTYINDACGDTLR